LTFDSVTEAYGTEISVNLSLNSTYAKAAYHDGINCIFITTSGEIVIVKRTGDSLAVVRETALFTTTNTNNLVGDGQFVYTMSSGADKIYAAIANDTETTQVSAIDAVYSIIDYFPNIMVCYGGLLFWSEADRIVVAQTA
jgi:hypothetical protein